jgi:hypothetical protein
MDALMNPTIPACIGSAKGNDQRLNTIAQGDLVAQLGAARQGQRIGLDEVQGGTGGPIGGQVRVQVGRVGLRREHGMDLQPDLRAEDGGCAYVIGTDCSEGDHRAPVFDQRLAQQEFQFADLVSAIGAA